VQLRPSQITHELAWDCTWDSKVKGWGPTTSGMAQPMLFFFSTIDHFGDKPLNTTLIILWFKMYITA
jgi:hypothetical protein